MTKAKESIKRLSKPQRMAGLILLLLFVILLVSINTPFLAKYKSRNTVVNAPTWGGSFDSVNPLATINIGASSWNAVKYELSTMDFNGTITFTIEDIVPIKEKYYYISNSSTPLNQTQISQISSWVSYNGSVQISTEGSRIIYAKVVDMDNNVKYINTDLLVIDLTAPTASLTIEDSSWSNLRSTLNNLYFDRQKTVYAEADDNLSGLASVKYYISNGIMNLSALNALSSGSWNTYNNGILINTIGTHVVYIKVTDNSNNITYINTDYIVLNGYSESNLVVGKNASSYPGVDAYITNKSSVSLSFSYSSSNSLVGSNSHNLMSNLLLPMGTKITLVDHIASKVYEYQVPTNLDNYNYNNSCDPGDSSCVKEATYAFTLFKEVGTGTVDKFFQESSYSNNGVINEHFSIILDLSMTNFSTNHNDISLYLELHDVNGNNIRPTLYNTIKKFNIYSNVDSQNAKAVLNLTTDYSGNEILFNSDSMTDINITSKINYKYVNGFRVTDSTYETKKIGLSLKVVDSDGNVVGKDQLKSLAFKIGNTFYYPEKDGIVRINLNSGISDVTKTVTIITNESNCTLKEGTYYLKISNYAAYDGVYDDNLGDTELVIQVNVSNSNYDGKFSFNVVMSDANRIINKTNNEVNVLFNILQNSDFDNPNIRVSLYKKDQLTAYDQTYSIVDLKNYVTNNLMLSDSNIYYVTTNPIDYLEPDYLYNDFELNLLTSNFESGAYKFNFGLYDGNKRVGTIEKHFVVR